MLDVIDNGEIYLHLLNKACLCIRKAVTLGEDFEQVAEVVSGMEGHPVHAGTEPGGAPWGHGSPHGNFFC